MSEIHASIACNLDSEQLLAALPLFNSGKVQGIEWSFDALFGVPNIPDWFNELLDFYGNAGRLVGHGIFFSLFSGKWSAEQDQWLKQLAQMSRQFQLDHVTEHFGFMTGADFHRGAPISVPFTKSTLRLGQDRLQRIATAANTPVGLENLAFAYSMDEVKRHGEFLSKLIEPVNGFIILDLHNFYCHLHNFDGQYDQLIDCYPLDRVREIHISGGSWEVSDLNNIKKIRRDTHDDAVPEEVFELLRKAIPKCPNLKFVVLEQLGTALTTPKEKAEFQSDFYKMEAIVQDFTRGNKIENNFTPPKFSQQEKPYEDLALYQEQLELSTILETARDVHEAKTRLLNSGLANSYWEVEHWEDAMLETVVKIAQKWR